MDEIVLAPVRGLTSENVPHSELEVCYFFGAHRVKCITALRLCNPSMEFISDKCDANHGSSLFSWDLTNQPVIDVRRVYKKSFLDEDFKFKDAVSKRRFYCVA